jgi:hypothetical protein
VAAAVVPRLSLIGFKFAQPFLINDLIAYVSANDSSELSGVKYGFIGATVLVYVGIAVSKSCVLFWLGDLHPLIIFIAQY